MRRPSGAAGQAEQQDSWLLGSINTDPKPASRRPRNRLEGRGEGSRGQNTLTSFFCSFQLKREREAQGNRTQTLGSGAILGASDQGPASLPQALSSLHSPGPVLLHLGTTAPEAYPGHLSSHWG